MPFFPRRSSYRRVPTRNFFFCKGSSPFSQEFILLKGSNPFLLRSLEFIRLEESLPVCYLEFFFWKNSNTFLPAIPLLVLEGSQPIFTCNFFFWKSSNHFYLVFFWQGSNPLLLEEAQQFLPGICSSEGFQPLLPGISSSGRVSVGPGGP